ncbi:MAG TPA: hypothetical protein VFL85_01455 [Candidatus Saccharimonadales bacterium]|nr:hypothetical protein [Candidatus Saccharimonadales bacterium]
MASLNQYRQALLDASNMTATGASPNASPEMASTIQHLQNAASSTIQAMAANTAMGAAGGAAGAQADQEQADAKARLQENQARQQQVQDAITQMSNPDNYQKVINNNGGYDFYNPMGEKITIGQYAKATNQYASDILKKSQDPADQQFVKDYKNLQTLGQVMQSGDKAALQKLYKQQPDLKDQIGDMTYDQLVKAFQQHYHNYIGVIPPNKIEENAGKQKITSDNRSLFQRVTDQLLPSFLGNANTYQNGYGNSANTFHTLYGG